MTWPPRTIFAVSVDPADDPTSRSRIACHYRQAPPFTASAVVVPKTTKASAMTP